MSASGTTRASTAAKRSLWLALAGLLAYPIGIAVLPHSVRDGAASSLWALMFLVPPIACAGGLVSSVLLLAAGRPRRGLLAAIAAFVIGGAAALGSGPLVFALLSQGEGITARAQSSACMSNLKQLGTALVMYTEDYDGRVPPTAGWNEPLRSRVLTYTSDRTGKLPLLECPAAPAGTPSYAMNASLAGVRLGEIDAPERAAALFDSKPGRNLAGGPELLPQPVRHRGDNIAFADGHVKHLKRGSPDVQWHAERSKPAAGPARQLVDPLSPNLRTP